MYKNQLRAPAVPLVTHDPLFSIWSFADKLTDDVTRHWDGQRHAMFGLLTYDNEIYEFMGKSYYDNARYSSGYRKLPQTGCEIRPMTTRYTFENEKLALELTFTSPLLLNDLMVLSRPVTYVDYKITPKEEGTHNIHVHFGFMVLVPTDDDSRIHPPDKKSLTFDFLGHKLFHGKVEGQTALLNLGQNYVFHRLYVNSFKFNNFRTHPTAVRHFFC